MLQRAWTKISGLKKSGKSVTPTVPSSGIATRTPLLQSAKYLMTNEPDIHVVTLREKVIVAPRSAL